MGKLDWAKRRLMIVVWAVLAVSSIMLMHACTGGTGPPSAQIHSGLGDLQIITQFVENDSDIKSAAANCPQGQIAVGGGVNTWPDQSTLAPTGVAIQASRPIGDSAAGVFGKPIGWFGAAHRVPGVGPPIVTWQLQVSAVCTRGPGTPPLLHEAPEPRPLDQG